MPTYTFQEVKHREARRLKCRTCGKRFTRSQTFTQTINPFNKNANGQVKTYREVLRDVVAKGAAWQPDDQCTPCAEAS
jgi:transcriptional regulator NrdR family protein